MSCDVGSCKDLFRVRPCINEESQRTIHHEYPFQVLLCTNDGPFMILCLERVKCLRFSNSLTLMLTYVFFQAEVMRSYERAEQEANMVTGN